MIWSAWDILPNFAEQVTGLPDQWSETATSDVGQFRKSEESEMTEKSMTAGQRRTLEIIEELWFGRIEELSIHDGQPCYERAPRIREEIKLASEPERRPVRGDVDLTLKREFEEL